MSVSVDTMSNCGKLSQIASTACPLPLSLMRRFSAVMEGKKAILIDLFDFEGKI